MRRMVVFFILFKITTACSLIGNNHPTVVAISSSPVIQPTQPAQPSKALNQSTTVTLPPPYTTRGRTDSESGEPEQFQGIIESHNAWRRQVNVPDLKWSNEMSNIAQSWANFLQQEGCIGRHNPIQRYGENIGRYHGLQMTPVDIVYLWASEYQYYDYESNTCQSGRTCGNYLQIIWHTTREVGCGTSACGATRIWVCNYNPPGNYVGQRPY